MQSQILLRGTTTRPLGSSNALRGPSQRLERCRLVAPRVTSAPDSVTDDEAERFEKIAAALVEKLKDLPDIEAEPEGK